MRFGPGRPGPGRTSRPKSSPAPPRPCDGSPGRTATGSGTGRGRRRPRGPGRRPAPAAPRARRCGRPRVASATRAGVRPYVVRRSRCTRRSASRWARRRELAVGTFYPSAAGRLRAMGDAGGRTLGLRDVHTFDAATRVTRASDRRYQAFLDEQWSIGGRLNGGYLLALLTGAALAEAGQSEAGRHEHPLAVTGAFAAAAPPGPVLV